MEPSSTIIVIKTAVTHTVSYLFAGLLAYTIFDYPRLFAETDLRYIMRQTNDPIVKAGLLFQPIRGIIFGIAFVILRQSFFTQSNGWLLMWIALVCLSVLGSFGPTTTSIEGMLFTTLPLRIHLVGLPEILLQSFLLSFIVFHWVNSPGNEWLNRTMWSLFVVVLLIPLLGLLAGRRRS